MRYGRKTARHSAESDVLRVAARDREMGTRENLLRRFRLRARLIYVAVL